MQYLEFSKSGRRFSGKLIIDSIAAMHERSNGLGGGFAAYGIYPEYKDCYAFHIFYDNESAKEECEKFLASHFDIITLSKIPVRKIPQITDEPMIWRYFMVPLPSKLADSQLDEREFVVRCVFRINSTIDGAYVFSSGKNMGVFKAVGFPEDVGRFYRLEEYMKDIALQQKADTLQILPAVGEGPILSHCLIIRWSIMARFRPTTPTGETLKCTDTSAC